METTKPQTVDIDFLEEFEELFNESWRNLVYYGGRGSGKTRHVGLALVLRGRTKCLRILCTRELQNTIGDSVHAVLKDIIDRYGFTDYVVTEKSIRNTLTGTEFIFRGLRHNATEIKSTEGVDIAWVEEAQSISEDSLKVLVPTIRKPGSQLIFTFNRLNELDPVYVRYVRSERPRTYVRKVNYDVLERAGLFPDSLREEMETDKATSLDLYAHVWLGEPQAQGENTILNRTDVLAAMERKLDPEGAVEVGVDVARMGGDRTVFRMRKGLVETKQAIYTQLRTTEVCDKLEAFVDYQKATRDDGSINPDAVRLKIDDTGVGGGVTDEMIRRGYSVYAINFGARAIDPDKYPNMISEAWFYLASIINTVSLEMNDELLMELSTRKWKMDSKGRRAIESKDEYKKRGFRSPDLADALIMEFYNVHHSPVPEKPDQDYYEPITSGLMEQSF